MIKADYKVLNCRLQTEVADMLDSFCEESGVSKTNAVNRILRQYLVDYFEKDESKRGLFMAKPERK